MPLRPPIPVILTSPTGEEYACVSYSSASRFLDGKGVKCTHETLKRFVVESKPIQGWNINHGTPIATTNAINPFLYVFGEDASGLFHGKSVRITSDTPKKVSIIDVIQIVCQVDRPHDVYERIVDHHPSILQLVQKHKFNGAGQRLTPVTDAQGLVTIIQHLPGENADRFRSGAANILVRFLGGDTTLADDVHAIAAHHDAVNSGEAPANIMQIFHEAVNSGEEPISHEQTNPEQSQIVEAPNLSIQTNNNKYAFESPTMVGKDLSMFNDTSALYMIIFKTNGEDFIKFGRTSKPMNRIREHLREIPDAKPYCMIPTTEPTRVELEFKQKMNYTGKLVTMQIKNKKQTEILHNIKPEDAEIIIREIVASYASQYNEKIKMMEMNYCAWHTLTNINKEITLKTIEKEIELKKIEKDKDIELKNIDKEIELKRIDNDKDKEIELKRIDNDKDKDIELKNIDKDKEIEMKKIDADKEKEIELKKIGNDIELKKIGNDTELKKMNKEIYMSIVDRIQADPSNASKYIELLANIPLI
jgi:hypothetical protein